MLGLIACDPSATPGPDSQQVVRPIEDLILAPNGPGAAHQNETDVIVARSPGGGVNCQDGRVIVTWAQNAKHWTASTMLAPLGAADTFVAGSTVVSTNGLPVPGGVIYASTDPFPPSGECIYSPLPFLHEVPMYDQKLSSDVALVRTNRGTIIQMGPGERRRRRTFSTNDSVGPYFDLPCTEPAFDVESLLFRVSTDCGVTWTMHSHLDVDSLHFSDSEARVITMDRPDVYYQTSEDALWVVGDAEDAYGDENAGTKVNKRSKILARYDRPADEAGGTWRQIADLGYVVSPAVMTSNPDGRLYVLACTDDGLRVSWVNRGETAMHSTNVDLPSGVTCSWLNVSNDGSPRDPITVGIELNGGTPKIDQGLRNLIPSVSVSFVNKNDRGLDQLRAVFPQIEGVETAGGMRDRQIANLVTFSIQDHSTPPTAPTLHAEQIKASYPRGSVVFMTFQEPDTAGGVSPGDDQRDTALLTWMETGGFIPTPDVWHVRITQKAMALSGVYGRSKVVTLTRRHDSDSYWTPMFKGCFVPQHDVPDGGGDTEPFPDRDDLPKSECDLGDYEYGAFDRRDGDTLRFLRVWPQHVPTPGIDKFMTTMFGNRVNVRKAQQP